MDTVAFSSIPTLSSLVGTPRAPLGTHMGERLACDTDPMMADALFGWCREAQGEPHCWRDPS